MSQSNQREAIEEWGRARVCEKEKAIGRFSAATFVDQLWKDISWAMKHISFPKQTFILSLK